MEFDSFTTKRKDYNRFEIYFDCLKRIKQIKLLSTWSRSQLDILA